MDHLIAAHACGPLLPAAAATYLFLVIGFADSIVCGARVVIDAGGKGKREYLDVSGQLLAAWITRRLVEKVRTKNKLYLGVARKSCRVIWISSRI
jgi:hypothetical protein